MPDPGAASAAVAEVSTTAGTGDFVLGGALPGMFRFGDFYADGDTITYAVSDTSYTEIIQGVYDATYDSLSRTTLIFSNTGSAISWPAANQRIIRPLVGATGAFCATAPVDGQVLVWQGADNDWCPDQRVIGPDASAGSGLSGRAVTLTGGAGDGVGNGGKVNITGGVAGATGGTGDIILTVPDGHGGGGVFAQAGASSGTSAGGFVVLSAGANTGLGGIGGGVTLNAGNSTNGTGGSLEMFGGQGGNSSDGGEVRIFAGDVVSGSGNGGPALLNAGSSNNADGGSATLKAGSGGLSGSAGAGGAVSIEAGSADGSSGNGGSIALTIGAGAGGDPDGQLLINVTAGGAPIIVIPNLPTSAPAVSHALWNNAGVINITP